MLHLQHKLRYFSFNLFSCHAPSTHQECIILKDFGFLIWWFLCCSFRNFWTCTWKLEGRAAFGLQGCCLKDTVAFWGKNTVQRRRLGITALPAASQEPQLLLLLLLCFRNWHFSAHYWPSATLMAINRSGWVHSTPIQSWSSLPRGTKRKVYPTSETCASVTTQLPVLEESFQTSSFALQAMRAWEQWQNTTSSDQNLTSVDCTDKLACTKSAMKAQNNL